MDQRFVSEMINTFRKAEHDDKKVRQYLALAMGRTGNVEFVDFLIETLPDENEDNIPFVINALGMLKDMRATKALYPFLQHNNPGVRLQTIIALGEIGDKGSLDVLRSSLQDPEPNVKWDAAVALAKMGSAEGSDILLNLLDESYLLDFKNVDYNERSYATLTAIKAAAMLDDSILNRAIKKLTESTDNMEVRKAALQALNK